ncbi:MAG: hypothetical protein JST13_02270, partial [Bacteroidetes bacterium]|nr:hypothetical protein [Bacteroidota bacterium]
EEFLEGTYISHDGVDSSSDSKGIVFLHKVPTSDFGKEQFLIEREKEIEKEKHRAPVTAPPAVAKKNPATKPVAGTKAPEKKSNTAVKSSKPKTTNGVKQNVPNAALKPSIAKTETPKETHVPAIVDSTHKIERKPVPDLVVPKVLANRKNELVKTITVSTNEVELRVYDDGTIDNDTVSIYVDNKNVINHAMLTDKPIIVKLHFDDNDDYHEVVMVAENEGEIPPNTSLMVVKAGDKEYEVRIVSTEQKNATVVFKFEKK